MNNFIKFDIQRFADEIEYTDGLMRGEDKYKLDHLDDKYAQLDSPSLVGTPTAITPEEGDSTNKIATTAFVMTAISNLIDNSPEALNTLYELATAINNDPDFATNILTQLGTKLNSSGGTITGNLTVEGTLTGNLTGNVEGNLTGNVTGNVSGNAGTATKLETAKNISISNSDGTGAGATVEFDGSDNIIIKLPSSIIANLTGNVTGNVSGNAGTADKLKTARTIAITGGATGTATSFDGSDNISIPVTGLNMDNANAGTLPVARGGTGTTSLTNVQVGVATTAYNIPTQSGLGNIWIE